MILVEAIKRGTSDIHIESYEKEFRIRYRIDGVLYEMHKPPLKLRDSVISRLKIMPHWTLLSVGFLKMDGLS